MLTLGALVELDGEAGLDVPRVEGRSLVQQHDGELLELAAKLLVELAAEEGTALVLISASSRCGMIRKTKCIEKQGPER